MTRNHPHGRRMPRMLAGLSLLLILVLALAACGEEGAAGDSPADDSGDNPSDDAGDDAADDANDDESAGEGDDTDTGDEAGDEDDTAAGGTVTVDHAQGSDEVPVNPETVVALNNSDFSALSAFGVELAAAPVSLMGDGSIWPEYADVPDVGNHREPNLEEVIAADPDLIITGMRMGQYYDDLVSDNPNAVVIDTSYDRETDDIGEDMKHYVSVLGDIFDAGDQADEINNAYDEAVADAQDAYDGESTVMGLITSGGSIQYVAPVEGRTIGPLFPILDLVPAMDADAEDTSHGDEISVEAIADADPDWIIALDRDGATSATESDYQPAEEVIGGSEALASTTAVSEDQIVYLDPTFYLTEDIQAYTGLFDDIAQAFSGAP